MLGVDELALVLDHLPTFALVLVLKPVHSAWAAAARRVLAARSARGERADASSGGDARAFLRNVDPVWVSAVLRTVAVRCGSVEEAVARLRMAGRTHLDLVNRKAQLVLDTSFRFEKFS